MSINFNYYVDYFIQEPEVFYNADSIHCLVSWKNQELKTSILGDCKLNGFIVKLLSEDHEEIYKSGILSSELSSHKITHHMLHGRKYQVQVAEIYTDSNLAFCEYWETYENSIIISKLSGVLNVNMSY